jgi:hypothetical protein
MWRSLTHHDEHPKKQNTKGERGQKLLQYQRQSLVALLYLVFPKPGLLLAMIKKAQRCKPKTLQNTELKKTKQQR